MQINVDFDFQSGEAAVYRELLEFGTAAGTGTGGKLVPLGHRVSARAAGECEKKKKKRRRATDLEIEIAGFIFVNLISDIATRA